MKVQNSVCAKTYFSFEWDVMIIIRIDVIHVMEWHIMYGGKSGHNEFVEYLDTQKKVHRTVFQVRKWTCADARGCTTRSRIIVVCRTYIIVATGFEYFGSKK